MKTLVSILLLGVAVGFLPDPAPQEMPVPISVQHPLLLKTLALDRELEARVGEEIVIGVVHQKLVRESWLAKDAFMEQLATSSIQTVKGIPVRGLSIEYRSREELRRIVQAHGVDVLYVAPMRAVEIGELTAVSRAHRISTLTGVPRFVSGGLSVGIGIKGSRPEVLINLQSAQAEGAHYSAQLLRLAHIIEN